MSAEKVGKRYAKALFDEAVQSGSLDNVYVDLNLLNNALNSSKELKSMFKSPVIPIQKKQTITTQIFSGKIGSITEKFLQLLLAHNRETYISDIIKAFFHLYNEEKGISEVTVTTAVDLDTNSEEKISRFIKEKSGYPNVKINKKTDPSIMGGFIVDFGGKLYDNSVKYKLNRIKKEISIQ
ncbi:MAG: hypothetical protein RJA25_1042 [Bacteroidota bacterium]|jgi:F-type H+-transporting ATPase subunit delta